MENEEHLVQLKGYQLLLAEDDYNVMNNVTMNVPEDDQSNEDQSIEGQQPDGHQPLAHHQVEHEDGQLRSDNESQPMYREQDLYLPITNISRIMKKCLPANHAKLSKESKITMQECVSEFILFIASEACEMARSEKQTLNGDDLIDAMARLGFQTASSNYIDPLKIYLAKYRQTISGTDKDGGDKDGGEK